MNDIAKKQRGFTIVELLIVIVVIAILAAISIVAYNGIQTRARDSQRKSDVATIQKALELYHIDNGGYPNCTGGTYSPGETRSACYSNDAGFMNALTPKYISAVPKDPVNSSDYRYRYVFGSRKVNDLTYTASADDNYVIGVSYQGQGGPYSTQLGPPGNTYNYLFGSSN